MANKETKNSSPIEELFTDSGPVELENLVKALKPFVKVKRGSKEIFLTPRGQKLGAKQKVLAYALTKKALKLAGREHGESVSAARVSKGLSGIPKGTIDVAFKDLREEGLFVGKGKDYEVSNDRVSEILENLRTNVDTSKK